MSSLRWLDWGTSGRRRAAGLCAGLECRERSTHRVRPYPQAVYKVVDEVLFVNAGSVGKPKDGDWRACYASIDVATRKIAFVRVAYDVERAMAAIRETELPPRFADDLRSAGSPASRPSHL